MWDADGREYIDLIAGISVCNVGHRHPKVVKRSSDRPINTSISWVYGELVENPQVAYAQKLTSQLPNHSMPSFIRPADQKPPKAR